MNQNLEVEILSELTFEEVKIVGKLMQSPERAMFVNGESGGVIGSLHKKGIVEQFVRVGKVYKWRLKEPFFNYDSRKFVEERLYYAAT